MSAVDRLTDDSAAITFTIPDDLRDQFTFRPGQSLTVKRGEERRSYSICAPAGAAPRIGVREVQGGHVSGWLVREVKPGDRVEVQAPTGRFTPDLAEPAHHVLIAAGSGITPMLSIAASALEAGSRVTLLYGNRRTNSVMFADEVADLKDAHPAALHLVHVLSREPQEVELFSGRLDADKLRRLLPVRHRLRRPSTTGGCAVRTAWSPTPSTSSPTSASSAAACTASCSTSRTHRPSRTATSRRRRPAAAR